MNNFNNNQNNKINMIKINNNLKIKKNSTLSYIMNIEKFYNLRVF